MLCNDSNKEQIVAFCDDRGQTVFANKIIENSKIANRRAKGPKAATGAKAITTTKEV